MQGFTEKSLFSDDSAKALKGQGFGYLNAIMYMSPAQAGGVETKSGSGKVVNLCPDASAGCIALCLGLESGQAAIIHKATGDNPVRAARRAKARAFIHDRENFLTMVERQIRAKLRKAERMGFGLVVRLNGSTDNAYERIRYGAERLTLLERFPDVQFDEYTKNFGRLARAPSNLCLTFSRSEVNERQCLVALERGHNVAVVFGEGLPATWNGYRVIDGDKHDLRHLDPRGVVVGLTPKGAKAKRDTSGFVVRGYAN